MIRTVADLIEGIAERGKEHIAGFRDVDHAPTVGSMYEGLTRTVLDTALFEGLDLRVVHGKIAGPNGELSAQLDCMVVFGDGEEIPFTDAFIYPISRVIAVVEVKKSLGLAELKSAYENLHSFVGFTRVDPEVQQFVDTSFRTITGQVLPEHPFEDLEPSSQMLVWSLARDATLPARIVLGFYGLATEDGLRRSFTRLLEDLPEELGRVQGFGPHSFPSLILSESKALVKLCGLPYSASMVEEEWPIIASSDGNNAVLLLEILWTKILQRFGPEPRVWGEDLQLESLVPLLYGTPRPNKGWEYRWVDVPRQALAGRDPAVSWEPLAISEPQANFLFALGALEPLALDDELLAEAAADAEMAVEDFLAPLIAGRIVSLSGTYVRYLTRECMVGCTSDGQWFAGENITGRTVRWAARKAAGAAAG